MNKSPRSTRLNLAMYDTGADDWWTGKTRWLRLLNNMVPPRLAYFNPIVGDWRGKSVLDLGCGGGFMAEPLARQGARVIGVDPSAPAIAAAKRHAEESGLAIDYHVGTGERLPVADNAVDIVVCVDVLEHVHDLDAVIGEIRRVLKPGGLFLFDTINRTWLSKLVIVTLGEIVLRLGPRGTHDPALFIRPEELRAKLDTAKSHHGVVAWRHRAQRPQSSVRCDLRPLAHDCDYLYRPRARLRAYPSTAHDSRRSQQHFNRLLHHSGRKARDAALADARRSSSSRVKPMSFSM